MPLNLTNCSRKSEMSSDSFFKTNWHDTSETEYSYTRLCVSALISAFFGLGTFLVYFTPWFFFLGVFAVLFGIFALWAIRNAEGILTGTSLAYFGLCSTVVALVSIIVFWASYQYGVRREADQFFRLWFVAVQQGNIPRAKEYQTLYAHRSKATDAEEWWNKQYEDNNNHRDVHQYVENKLIRALMSLGDKAKISYYKTLDVVSESEVDAVVSVYAVSFLTESGKTKTFFVRIAGNRRYPAASTNFKAAGWYLADMPTFYLPEEFKKI